MKTTIHLLPIFMASIFTCCKKEFDHPPVKHIPDGNSISIKQIKSRVTALHPSYRFTNDTTLHCIITADESSGNFYKCVFVQDSEGEALRINLLSGGGLYIGDKIRINLNDAVIKLTAGSLSLDSVDLEKNIVKISSGNPVMAFPCTINQIKTQDLQSKLVEINGVEFIFAHRNVSLGDAVNRTTKELILTDCHSNTLTLRTSGYADYAANKSPEGNGRITGIVGRHNNGIFLELRRYKDLQMAQAPCTGSATTLTGTFVLAPAVQSINENFSGCNDQADFDQDGWINYNENGKAKWKGNVKAVIYKALKATAFGTGESSSCWLIAPPIVYKPSLKISFRTGVEYFKIGHQQPVMAYLSTDFDGTNLKTANWTALDQADYAGSSDGNYTGAGGLRSSGIINLNTIPLLKNHSGTFCLAFKYSGGPGHDTNIYLDDLVVE